MQDASSTMRSVLANVVYHQGVALSVDLLRLVLPGLLEGGE